LAQVLSAASTIEAIVPASLYAGKKTDMLGLVIAAVGSEVVEGIARKSLAAVKR